MSSNLKLKNSEGSTLTISNSDSAATDTYQADYNTVNDKIVFVDNGGNLPTYNSGKIASSGVIDISGWYKV